MSKSESREKLIEELSDEKTKELIKLLETSKSSKEDFEEWGRRIIASTPVTPLGSLGEEIHPLKPRVVEPNSEEIEIARGYHTIVQRDNGYFLDGIYKLKTVSEVEFDKYGHGYAKIMLHTVENQTTPKSGPSIDFMKELKEIE